MDLLKILKEIAGAFSGYRAKCDQLKQEYEQLKLEYDQLYEPLKQEIKELQVIIKEAEVLLNEILNYHKSVERTQGKNNPPIQH